MRIRIFLSSDRCVLRSVGSLWSLPPLCLAAAGGGGAVVEAPAAVPVRREFRCVLRERSGRWLLLECLGRCC